MTEPELSSKKVGKRSDPMEEQVRWLAAIVESSEDAIIGKDLEGRIVSWNRAAERLFGYRKEEVVGKSIEILMPPDRTDDWRQILARVAGGERVELFETTRRRKDGGIVDVSLTVSPVRDASGRIVGAAKIARDITAARKAERERETTRELFLGTLGHDLRNPLNTIKVSADTLGRNAREADRRIVERIGSSTDRMSRMIDQLLDFTRCRLGRGIPVHPETADLAAICRTATDELEALHPGRIQVSVSGDLQGYWDSDRLAEAVSNLLSNALKYGDAEEPVRVMARGRGDAVSLVVTNRGPEIPASLVPVVFDPFRRGPVERREKKGLGLGLYITQQIVRAHQGEIAVTSSVRDGTTFSVTLPRRAVSAAP